MFAEQLRNGAHGQPFRWDDDRRFLLRCELDAFYFHLYSIGRDDVDYIMDTFPITRRKEEQQYGEYRTKRLVLEIYDAMAEAQRTGTAYQTRLDPPPADPRVTHPAMEQPVALPSRQATIGQPVAISGRRVGHAGPRCARTPGALRIDRRDPRVQRVRKTQRCSRGCHPGSQSGDGIGVPGSTTGQGVGSRDRR